MSVKYLKPLIIIEMFLFNYANYDVSLFILYCMWQLFLYLLARKKLCIPHKLYYFTNSEHYDPKYTPTYRVQLKCTIIISIITICIWEIKNVYIQVPQSSSKYPMFNFLLRNKLVFRNILNTISLFFLFFDLSQIKKNNIALVLFSHLNECNYFNQQLYLKVKLRIL